MSRLVPPPSKPPEPDPWRIELVTMGNGKRHYEVRGGYSMQGFDRWGLWKFRSYRKAIRVRDEMQRRQDNKAEVSRIRVGSVGGRR